MAVSLAALTSAAILADAKAPQPAGGDAPTPQAIEFFEKKVRPLLFENCLSCHGEKQQMGGLRLDNRAALLKGGSRGAALIPGQPEKSLLMQAVHYEIKGMQMPPAGKLPEAQIAVLTEWVKMGAPWPGAKPPAAAPAGGNASGFDLKARAKRWSFQPIRRATVPKVKNAAWPRNPIDAFLLAKMEAKRIRPAPPADRRTLLRRVTFDLIGLPPTPEEIRAFLADKSPNAYEKVVDRLLASPHYGERWARRWLDLVRYAETDGHEFDFDKPGAYQYRDYLIRAFNADVPYPQFVTEHIAGDLLPNPRLHPTAKFNESIIGTGFFWLGEGKHSPVDIREDQVERADNQIDVFSKAFLGLSVGCARCHDHKFDPISTKDYYALAGYLRSSRFQLADIAPQERPRQAARALKQLNARLHPLLLSRAAQRLPKALSRVAEHLLAAREALDAGITDPAKQADALAKIATRRGVAPEMLRRWLVTLRERAGDPGDPLHAWLVLSDPKAAASPEAFAQRREELAQAVQGRAAKAKEDQRNFVTVEDFSAPDFGDWIATGAAFGPGPVEAAPVIADDGKSLAVSGLLSGGMAHSGRFSNALHGALRSQTFTISKNVMLFRMAGRAAQVRLIIDGFQRIRFPIYGGLEIAPNSDRFGWHAMDVSKWVGHRAYIEFVDLGPGYIAVEKVAFADKVPTAPPGALAHRLLAGSSVISPEMLARKYQALLTELASAWEAPQATPENQEIGGWLLANRALLEMPAEEAPAELAALTRERRALEAAVPEPSLVMAMADGTGEDEYVHIRGSHKTLGPRVPRRTLTVLGGEKNPAPKEGSGRLELAQRLVAPSDPLLARVRVNRLWHHHFGRGIVGTPDDFGFMGERPTHPELLDWLATEFIRQGWSLKKMHRLMVTSAAYRQASRADAKADGADPRNLLLHKMPVRRLEAEAIRDAILAVSGRLDRRLYGPSVLPFLTPFMEGRGRPDHSGPLDGDGRRSLYISVRRNFLTPMFLAFDFPVPFTTIGRRTLSNVPAQALTLMNNPFVVEQAQLWAKRALAEAGTPEQRIARLYETAFGRLPSPAERDTALKFLAAQQTGGADAPRAWADLCHVLFNVKEFVFLH